MGFGVGRPQIKLKSILGPVFPRLDNVFDLGSVAKRWRNCNIGGDLTCGGRFTCNGNIDAIGDVLITGNLTVEGVTTTINSVTLTVDDKNIELASTDIPSDALADGGGITLKGTTDKTILWKDATDSWDFNQAIQVGNLRLDNNIISAVDTFAPIIFDQDVGIGITDPDAQLHVQNGVSGVTNITSGTVVAVESNINSYLSILAPDANERGIIFGNATSGQQAGIFHLANDSLEFRNAGDTARLTIDTSGNISANGSITAGQLNADNLRLDGNTISSQTGDLDVTTQTGGVFKFVDNAFRAGLDASNYLELGHGGSNSFLNHVGAGGMDFRFGGVNKASFTTAGHLHLLTDTDQKHNLKIKTANNANDSGIAWENSGGNFSQTIFRTDVGSNRSDLVFAIGSDANIDNLTPSFRIHGEAADEGKLEVLGAFQISSGNPGIGKVWTDAGAGDGIGTWTLSSGGGFTDAGDTIILTNINDSVGIGESGPDSKLHVTDGGTAGTVTAAANSIATFEKNTNGFISVLTPGFIGCS